MRQPLFVEGDLYSTLEEHLAKARRAVDDLPEARFRSSSPVSITAEILTEWRVRPLVLTEGAVSVQAADADIDRRLVPNLDWGFEDDPPTIRGTRVTFNVPYAGDQILFRLKPSSMTSVVPRVELTATEVRFVYDVQSGEVASTKQMLEHDLALLRQWLGWVNDDVAKFEAQLTIAVTGAVNQRASRLSSADAGLEALGLPVRRNTNVAVDAQLAPSSQTQPRPPTPATLGPSFDIALSFAGEDRPYVQEVAQCLLQAGAAVFYDEFQTLALWGKDLVAHLQDIYQTQARFCVLFISQYYVNKPWPSHERRSAQARALVAKEEYLLPARFDDAVVPGLPPTVGYVDLRRVTAPEFARMILAKIGHRPKDA